MDSSGTKIIGVLNWRAYVYPQGDLIGRFFANWVNFADWATFGGSVWFFEKIKFLGYFLFKQIYFIFT